MKIPATSDVCIVGGGPAGLAAAIALAQAGYRTIVLDCATPPIDKACGEGLLPDSLAVLSELGVAIPPGVGFHFTGICFIGQHSSVAAAFPAGRGIGIRRTVLHSLLIHRAQELGVNLIWGAKDVHLAAEGVRVADQFIASPFVVAADGQNSRMRREAGLSRTSHEQRRFGFRRHYRIEPWSSHVELHWGPKSQLYITPVASDEVSVALIAKDPHLRLDAALPNFPEVEARLRNAHPVSKELGALSTSRRLSRVCTSRVALLGDASGSVDAITGEGMCLAWKQALVLAKAMRAGDLRIYQSRHRHLSRRPQTMAALLLALDTYPSFQNRALAALARRPEFFQNLLSVHVGAKSFKNLLSWDLVNLCQAFLLA